MTTFFIVVGVTTCCVGLMEFIAWLDEPRKRRPE